MDHTRNWIGNMKSFLKKHYDICAIAVVTLLILFCYGGFSPVLVNDSQGYIDMEIIRSPLYPSFLWLFRTIFGASSYLKVVIAFQTILAAVAVCMLAAVLKYFFDYRQWLNFIFYPFLMVPFIMEKVLGDGEVYSKMILTEGLAYPLFYIFVVLLIVAMFSDKHKSRMLCTFGMFAMAAVLILLRGQMQLCVIIATLFSLYYIWEVRKDRKLRTKVIWAFFGGALLTLFVTQLGTRAYTKHRFGEELEPEFSNTSYMINYLYASDYSDLEMFKDEEDYELICQVFDEAFASGYTYENRGSSLIDKSVHIMDANCYLKLHLYIPMATEYYEAKGYDEVETYKAYEALAKTMKDKLSKKHGDRWLEGYMALFLTGVPDAVFLEVVKVRVICYVIAFVMLIAAFAYSVYKLVKDHGNKEAKFMIAVLIMMGGNLAACCLVIGPILRYLTYFWGLFYVAAILLILPRK